MSNVHEIALNCLIWGEDFGQGFVVQVPGTLHVADLKGFIKRKRGKALHDVDADDIRLFKVSLPTGQQLEQSLSSLVLDSVLLLDPFDRVSEVFPDGVPPKRIHILVKKTDNSSTTQQVREQEDVLTELAKAFKIATTITSKSPSVAAKSNEYVKIQSGLQRIFDCRCSARNPLNTVAPPIQLLHPAFAYFSSNAFNPTYDIPDEVIHNVRDLMAQFAQIHSSEGARHRQIKSSLARVLGRSIVSVMNSDRTSADFVSLDSSDELPVYLVIGEEKREFGDGGSDPSVQASFSYQRLFSQEENTELRNKCCCPAFIIAHAGPWLTIMGGVLTANWVVQRLTDYLWIPPHSTLDEAQYQRIARVLYALRMSIQKLLSWYEKIKGLEPYDSLKPTSHPRFFPSPNKYRYQDGLIEFEYREPLERNETCVTYRARTVENGSPQDIVIKFVTSYGEDAHRVMASSGFAPKLLYCGPINVTPEMPLYGDLRMVVMEYVDGLTFEEAVYQGKVPKKFKDDLLRSLGHLHDGGFVFGDLRAPNVMITPEETCTVQLIDFDWAGKEGEVRYPVSISSSIKWPEGVQGLGLIRKEHDLAMSQSLMSGWSVDGGINCSRYGSRADWSCAYDV